MFYGIMAFLNLVFIALLYDGLTSDMPADSAEDLTDRDYLIMALQLLGPIVALAATNIITIIYNIVTL